MFLGNEFSTDDGQKLRISNTKKVNLSIFVNTFERCVCICLIYYALAVLSLYNYRVPNIEKQ